MASRIFYACHAVKIGGSQISGAQSVSMNTNFNLENVFQLGKLQVYDNVAADPEVDLTVSKALDGRSLIWNLFTGANNASLINQGDVRKQICLIIGNDNLDEIDDGATQSICMSGMYMNSVNYTFPVEGNLVEEMSFVGSAKTIGTVAGAQPQADPLPRVLRRQNVKLASCTLPAAVSGRNLSNISISASFNREKMFKLGQVSPFHRFINFPVEITVTFDVIPSNSNNPFDGPGFDELTTACVSVSVSPEPIVIKLCKEGVAGTIVYEFDLGNKATLQTVAYSGGDTGGGNVTMTYTYQVFNDLTITYNP